MWKVISKVRNFIPTRIKDLNLKSTTGKLKETSLQTLPTLYNSVKCLNCNNGFEKLDRRDFRAKQKGSEQINNEWFEAFGWSGVIFLSWVLCFPCNRRKLSRNPAERYAFNCLANLSSIEYSSLVTCISHCILQPSVKYVLPTVRAVKSKSDSPIETDENEVLKTTCENLEAAHEKVMSSLNNWLGTESMQAGRHGEAYHYFSAAADSNNAAGLFNLGLCHELGIGTAQSFSKAATLYRRASDQGHATAMYNLGVFHVHGWGGVEADVTEAQLLFTTAAKLGQREARKALHWDEDYSDVEADTPPSSPAESSSSIESQLLFRDIVEPKPNDMTDLWLKVLNVKLTSLKEESEAKNVDLESNDSGIVSPTKSQALGQWST